MSKTSKIIQKIKSSIFLVTSFLIHCDFTFIQCMYRYQTRGVLTFLVILVAKHNTSFKKNIKVQLDLSESRFSLDLHPVRNLNSQL